MTRVPLVLCALLLLSACTAEKTTPPAAATAPAARRPRVPLGTVDMSPGADNAAAGTSAPAPASAPPNPFVVPVMPDLAALKFTTNPSGLKWMDEKVGDGPKVIEHGVAHVHYSNWLENGQALDSSVNRGKSPYPIKNVGHAPNVPVGCNEGLMGMRVGGKRLLIVPPQLGYGEDGKQAIYPGASVVFEMEVMSVEPPPPTPPPMDFPDFAKLSLTTNDSGLEWADVKVGTGSPIREGTTAHLHYTYWLPDGTKIDSTIDAGETFPVNGVGHAEVIPALNEGLVGMLEGGRRVLVVPPHLGFGDAGVPPAIPPKSTLVYVIDAVYATGP
jgi:peptidylprolyl isomerase